MSISNITGSPVEGDDFFDREWEFGKLVETIEGVIRFFSELHVELGNPR